jgi:hypothetical protein
MSKFGKAFRALGLIIKQPSLLNLVLNEEGVMKRDVVKKYGFEMGLPQVDITTFLPDEGIEVVPFAALDGGCLPTDLALLKALCIRNKVRDYLEIGTWRGESVANVASVVPHCVTVNLPDEQMKTMGLPEDYIGMHRFFSEKLPNVQHIQADSHSFDFTSLNCKFDLIFIDGDHHTTGVAKDTTTAFGLLKDEHSMIVWHDYALEPETPRFEVLKGILDGCPPAAREHLYYISNTLCAIYTKEVLNSRFTSANEKPGHYFTMQIKSKDI